ncbi:TetR/AcrR family transcriptional regulator [Mycobacterium vicinigordonae]|uniref:TetR/AcrR family transcriptional regulator n=1 Tax=Mycobacterium vicinigordonae TaxID=1719132 RepID=A0A7D6I9V7_9MYCO|nr:TetR/AcrR family transcriptional regulator [Mycobacterium vicinigordonae]QLL08237.1 TetR/AcrR family transcriptional regulator [Mycobacterium vicinigordonae]
MSTSPDLGTERRRRPRDRKEQIARVSAEAFSELGYHAVSMELIAARVGVTAASLYRHYDRKYDLFREAVLALGEQLVACTAFLDDERDDPEDIWNHAVAELISTTLRNRTSGGLYRWEGRYLKPDDQEVLNEQIKLVNRRLQRPLSRLRPQLTSRQRWTLSSAVLSVIGSITDHRAQLPDDQIYSTLTRIARAVRDADLPDDEPGRDRLATPSVAPAAGDYEQILHVAIMLFNERGYRETGMDDIAAAAHLPTTSLYRFFSGKGAILATIYRRAADRVSSDVSEILGNTDAPVDAVTELVAAYVRRSFARPELAYVYYAERSNVPAEERTALRSIQHATVEAWVQQVHLATPEIPTDEARFAVHAAFSMVVDLGRLMQYENTEISRGVVCHLLCTTLLGPLPETATAGRSSRTRQPGR